MAVNKFPVEGSHIMMFARSIADDNQIYYDADYAATTEQSVSLEAAAVAVAAADCMPSSTLSITVILGQAMCLLQK